MFRLFSIPIVLSLVVLFSCSKEEKLISECLDTLTVLENEGDCVMSETSEDCELIHLGYFDLTSTAKSQFIDFCTPLDGTLSFVNVGGQTLEATVTEKEFIEDTYTIHSFGQGLCKTFCLDNERATLSFVTDKFSLDLNILTTIANGHLDVKNISVIIFARKGNTRQDVFDLSVEDFDGNPIDPDTTRIRYHENISLNGLDFTDIYSNENNDGNGLVREEKIYYSINEGLIAVQDSLGTMWLKEI